MWRWQDSGGSMDCRCIKNDIVRSASLPHRVLYSRNGVREIIIHVIG